MNEVLTLNDESKHLLNVFIKSVQESHREIEERKEEIKVYKQNINDSILNLQQKTGIEKKVLVTLAKTITEKEKIEEQRELLEIVEALLGKLGK